jgi:Phytanoyl-CoA dioxygenase (PhyH)
VRHPSALEAVLNTTFPSIDFDRYHREELPRLLAGGRDALVQRAARDLPSLALRVRNGETYTYRITPGRFEVVPGDDAADTVLELDHPDWEGLVHQLEAPAGLLYAGRLRCLRGHAIDLMAWEPALLALYAGRPLYDPEALDLRDAAGQPLDVERTFTLDERRDELAHFLRVAGYAFVRSVFAPDEIAAFRAEADTLRAEARPGDRRSWWGRDVTGAAVVCRVTRANAKPRLATLPTDPRLLRLRDLADEVLVHYKGEGDGVTVIYKHPDVVEGLGDIPWHRDCGMGGHAVTCPILLASVYLTEATPESGELTLLPGSRLAGFNAHVATPASLAGAHFDARPGDVSLHYGDTIHAAPPPTARDLPTYRVSAIVAFAPPGARPHRGQDSYNDALHQRTDGRVEHLSVVAKRTPGATHPPRRSG